MENSTRNVLLFIGIALILAGILLWYFSIFKLVIMIIFLVIGIILIIIGIYNWGAGPDLSHKQEYPIENEDIEFERF